MKEILTLLQLQQEGEVHLATIGGFDLVYEGERFGKSDGYRYEHCSSAPALITRSISPSRRRRLAPSRGWSMLLRASARNNTNIAAA